MRDLDKANLFAAAMGAIIVTVLLFMVIFMLTMGSDPDLAPGVMKVTAINCANHDEDGDVFEDGGQRCRLTVRVPGNPTVKGVEYIRVLQPGEELAKEEAE